MSALLCAAYARDVVLDPPAVDDALTVLLLHVNIAAPPALRSAVLSTIAWLDDWVIETGLAINSEDRRERDFRYLAEAVELCDDWVRPRLQLLDLQIERGDMLAAHELAGELTSLVRHRPPPNDESVRAFEGLFTGRLTWDAKDAQDATAYVERRQAER